MRLHIQKKNFGQSPAIWGKKPWLEMIICWEAERAFVFVETINPRLGLNHLSLYSGPLSNGTVTFRPGKHKELGGREEENTDALLN